MAKQNPASILAQIRNPGSVAEQIAALRALKNDVTGHQQRKEMWIGMGIMEPVVRLLNATKPVTKLNGKERHDQSSSFRPLSEAEMIRLQALCVIGSLASGGASFLSPLHAAGALPAVLCNIIPTNQPAQLVLAALRALSSLADSIALDPSGGSMTMDTLAEGLFSRKNLVALRQILSQSSSSGLIQSEISLAASLISRVCMEEHHQVALANAGVLDALATRLASIAVSQGMVIPGAEIIAQRDDMLDDFPPAAPRNADIASILEAIAAIISDSKYRASQLLYSRSLLAIFPVLPAGEFVHGHPSHFTWNPSSPGFNPHSNRLNAMDFLLPEVPVNQLRGVSVNASAFPPLGSAFSRDHFSQLSQSMRSSSSRFEHSGFSGWPDLNFDAGSSAPENFTNAEDAESPFFGYLIWLTRNSTGLERLMAASVLTMLYRAGLASKSREVTLGLLIVPILVRLLDDEDIPRSTRGKDPTADAEAMATDWIIKERAPEVLAMLITDSEHLQKAAFDAGVINKLSKMIKVAYDPVLESSQTRPWSPNPGNTTAPDPDETGASRLGQSSISPLLVHRIKQRVSVLKAIAAMLTFKDEYRREFIEKGIVPYIVESLRAHPDKPSAKIHDKTEKPGEFENRPLSMEYGANPTSVLIAACGAIRALSRSVSALRTTLIDHGVAVPVFALLQHPDIEVRISSTAAVCNLVTDFSPMREPIQEAGILKILCEHAHSMNARLRLEALWALKHLVLSAGNDVKRTCLEELGQGWLVRLICDDTEDEALLSSRTKDRADRTYVIEEDIEEDIEMGEYEDSDSRLSRGLARCASIDMKFDNNNSRPSSSRANSAIRANEKLEALRELEMNPERRARKDDIAVQEQGLDFIRNLIGGAGQNGTSDTPEMIDFLFNALGQDRVFEILSSKLRPRIINPYNKRSSVGGGETRVVPPQPEIITAVAYILVHMAASIPRHRQLVIAQTELLKLLVPQLSHPNKEVRLSLCWLLTNLTSLDDRKDRLACAERAQELKKLGFSTKLEAIVEHDPELDVKERAKTALHQMTHDI